MYCLRFACDCGGGVSGSHELGEAAGGRERAYTFATSRGSGRQQQTQGISFPVDRCKSHALAHVCRLPQTKPRRLSPATTPRRHQLSSSQPASSLRTSNPQRIALWWSWSSLRRVGRAWQLSGRHRAKRLSGLVPDGGWRAGGGGGLREGCELHPAAGILGLRKK